MPPEFWLLPSFLPMHPGLHAVISVDIYISTMAAMNLINVQLELSNVQLKCGATVVWCTCLCHIYMAKGSLDRSHRSSNNSEKNSTFNLTMKLTGRKYAIYVHL